MKKQATIKVAALLLIALIASLPSAAQQQKGKSKTKELPAPAPTPLLLKFSYTVAFPQPHTHLYEITCDIGNVTNAQLDLSLPVWTPGSYLVREYARHVQDFAASSETGQQLTWEKIDKATWRITTGIADDKPRNIRAFYRVYANELATQTSHLDATHAYFNGASLFMYSPAAKDQPHRVRFKLEGPTADWRVASPLALAPDADGYYTAPNYDVLIDSPTEIGTHKLLEFAVRGKPHRVSIWGEFNFDENQLKTDLAKIVEECAKIFGGLPYEHYLFLVGVQPGIGGGTEHLNSNVSLTRPEAFKIRRGYLGFLGLEAHEYFHCFNVKRIRPRALGPFDYQRENYTKHLWVSEGMTSYYGDLILRRAGLTSVNEYLQAWGQTMAGYLQTPGRFQQSATTASFNAWIKHYRPDENSPNTAMSYYTKGEILGLLFDLEIRLRTKNEKSLDDVMRLLLENYGLPKPGFTDEELQAAFEKVAGADLTDLFRRYVYGTDELDLMPYWRLAGFQPSGIYLSYPSAVVGAQGRPGTLGLRTRPGGTVVGFVLAGQPAYESGLNAGDELVALDGRKLDAGNTNERLNEIREQQRVTLTVFRRERLLTFELTAALRPFDAYGFAPLKDLTDWQKDIQQTWLHEAAK